MNHCCRVEKEDLKVEWKCAKHSIDVIDRRGNANMLKDERMCFHSNAKRIFGGFDAVGQGTWVRLLIE